MEPSSLIKAHAHARSAMSKHLPSNVTSAIEEHSVAAGEFAQAAKGTGDPEALRTLKLLEQHHQKLSQILNFRSSLPNPPPVTETTETEQGESNEKVGVTAASASKSAAPQTAQRQRSSSPQQSSQSISNTPLPQRTPPRDLTSSIASNLATARGIPSSQQRRGTPVSPTLSIHHAGGKILNSPDKAKSSDARTSRVRPIPEEKVTDDQRDIRGHSTTEKQAHILPNEDRTTSSKPRVELESPGSGVARADEPFQRFYSTFESLLSKLSAPLAFAGLPLTADQEPLSKSRDETTAAQNDRPLHSSAEPDLNKIFSKASLRAIKESSGQGGGIGAGGESFYVVPSTGGTISYAGILSRAEHDHRGLEQGHRSIGDSLGEDEAEFVDARESPQPPSPGMTRKSKVKIPKGSMLPTTISLGGSKKTTEELQLENHALKQLSDTLSRRLHMWEVNAQSSSIALQQSLRAMSQPSASVSDAGKSTGEDVSDKIRELEDQLKVAMREVDKTTKENEKLKIVVGRYREKWEKLKEGARMRRETGGGDGKTPNELPKED
ncbi:MAG: hypothetical protein M4579_003216 [Chaenotheca gracillima]|nr:MAG: hypothetical protein M4579_003216 [Chaenotheca gracillima]